MLTRKRPETITANITLLVQGETVKFKVTFFNRTQAQIDAKIQEGIDAGLSDSDGSVDLFLYLVQDMESEYPLYTQGVKDMEEDCPGICKAMLYTFYESRVTQRAKN